MVHVPSSEVITPPHDPAIGFLRIMKPTDRPANANPITKKVNKNVFIILDHTIFEF